MPHRHPRCGASVFSASSLTWGRGVAAICLQSAVRSRARWRWAGLWTKRRRRRWRTRRRRRRLSSSQHLCPKTGWEKKAGSGQVEVWLRGSGWVFTPWALREIRPKGAKNTKYMPTCIDKMKKKQTNMSKNRYKLLFTPSIRDFIFFKIAKAKTNWCFMWLVKSSPKKKRLQWSVAVFCLSQGFSFM